jgi:hypothetical protein
VPSPQSIRKRYSSCITTWAERPRRAEGAEAEVPKKTISNKEKSFYYRDSKNKENGNIIPEKVIVPQFWIAILHRQLPSCIAFDQFIKYNGLNIYHLGEGE